MWKRAACYDILTAGGEEKQVIAFSSYNLVKVSCPLTVPFEILEKSWKTPEELHFEKNIFAKKNIFRRRGSPQYEKFLKKNFDENFSWIHWATL